MRVSSSLLMIAACLHLAACGGSGAGGSTAVAGSTASAAPAPTPTASGPCSLAARQTWAKGVLDEWYLFPETIPVTLDPAGFSSVSTYVDALTATARAERRDRFFTFLTSIAEETAFFSSGSSAGFGIRLSSDAATRRTFIAEAFEGAPALAAGIDRGTELIAIGETPANLRLVSDIIAAEGVNGVSNALGPSNAGVARTLRFVSGGVTREATVTKADFSLTPISARYGARVIDDGGRRIGYLNLRTFISTADNQLRSAFDQFRALGVTEFVIDFRYNGGGLVSTAELMGDLLGRNRLSSEIFSQETFRPSKSSQNSTKRFAAQPQSVSPVKIAFIGTGATASASELVINGMQPFLGNNMALIGSNTFGKPVGQIALDQAACDDRLRVVAFATQNGVGNANYFDGLATTVNITCRAGDDLTRQLGDPSEASLRQALDFLAGRSCTPITAVAGTTAQRGTTIAKDASALLTPDAPTLPQREVPGFF